MNAIGFGFCAAKKLPSAIIWSRVRLAAIGDISGFERRPSLKSRNWR